FSKVIEKETVVCVGDYSCYPGEWPCPSSGRCIPLSKVCDNSNDCVKGGDEGDGCSPSCKQQLSCDHACKATPTGEVCYCQAGYTLDPADNRTCVDFDECSVWGFCDQLCENTRGTYQCSCRSGYTLEGIRTCKAADSSSMQLVVSTGSKIMRMDRHGQSQTDLVTVPAADLDFDIQEQLLFYINKTDKQVYKTTLDGGGRKERLPIKGLALPIAIAWDWLSGNLYILDQDTARIDLYELNLGYQHNLMSNNMQRPTSIAIDPLTGYLFYADLGNSGPGNDARIERAFMDGSNRISLKLNKILNPRGLTVDSVNQRLFWVDSHLDHLETVDYSGLNRRTVISGGLNIPSPTSVAVFENEAFWTDFTKQGVLSIDMYKGASSSQQLYQDQSSLPTTVRVMHKSLQGKPARGSSPCEASSCQQICAISHSTDNSGMGFRCLCKSGFKLDKSGINCTEIEKFILFASPRSVRAIPIDGTGIYAIDAIPPIVGQQRSRLGVNYVAIDYDAQQELVFFSDVRNRVIYQSKIGVSEPEPLVVTGIGSVEGMSYDWIGKNLYFTDFRRSTVSVVRVNQPKDRRDLITDLGNARSIVVHPLRGQIFYSDWLRNSRQSAYIASAHMDGENIVKIREHQLGWPNGLSIDYGSNRLYWADAFFDRIQHSEFDGGDLKTLGGHNVVHPFGIAIYKEYIYYTDWRLESIVRVNKHGGDEKMLRNGMGRMMGIRVYDPALQPLSTRNPCGVRNGECSHFCFGIPDTGRLQQVARHCGCPFGMKLDRDQRTCIGSPTEIATTTCRSSLFQCDNGRCIPSTYRCDRDNDCLDNSDEANCPDGEHTCPPSYFQCDDKRCIPQRRLCDGGRDCYDGSDERDCPPLNCTGNRWTCSSTRQCILSKHRCDGVEDCDDGSDEQNCSSRPPNDCHNEEFKCAVGGCIPLDWKCDGQEDCEDGSDEPATCPPPPFSCPPGKWECPGGTQVCINVTLVCDGNIDCPEGHDESPVCNSESCRVDNGGCSHRCLQTPRGAECQCPAGQELNGTKICIDMDECDPPGRCSQLCQNMKGSYKCECVEQYVLLPDRHTCKVQRNDSELFLLIASRRSVVKSNMEVWLYDQLPLPGFQSLTAIDMNVRKGHIFFSDTSLKKIFRSTANGTNLTEIVATGIDVVEDIAVDWVGGNLYWTDYGMETIEVVTLDGNYRMVLFSENITNPRAIEVDPRDGARYLFWSDWGQNPRIERSGLDGSGRTVLVTKDLFWPNALTIDYPTKRLYFADARMDFIEFCMYDGSGRVKVFGNDHFLRHPHSLTIYEDWLYWSDRAASRVSRCKKFNCTDRSVVASSIARPLGIAAYNIVKQPSGSNPCQAAACSHLCLLSPKPTGYSCACPIGMKLDGSAHSCVKDASEVLLFMQSHFIAGIQIGNSNNTGIIPVSSIAGGLDFDFDSADGYIYYVEKINGSLKRIQVNGRNASEFVPTAVVGMPSAVAVDWMSRNLYWTNAKAGLIEVMRMDGDQHYRKVLLSNSGRRRDVARPISICLDPRRGMLYWGDEGLPGVEAKVSVANMDGSNAHPLTLIGASNVRQPAYLALDVASQYLYVSDTYYQKIWRYSLRSMGIATTVVNVGSPTGIAFFNNRLYYYDSSYETINVAATLGLRNTQILRSNIKGVGALKVYHNRHQAMTSFVIVSMRSTIRGFGMSRRDADEAMTPIAGRARSTTDIDVYMPGRYIYWVDSRQGPATSALAGGIYRIKPDGTGFQAIINSGIGTHSIRGLSVDWIAGNIYFTNSFDVEVFIEVARVNGSHRKVIVRESHGSPAGVAVNPIKRYLYWADMGQTAKIERSLLDGTNRTVLVQNGISLPRAITIDFTTHNVYWIDSVIDAIQSISFSGGNRRYVQTNIPNGYGLSVFENYVYWVDQNLKNLFRTPKSAGINAPFILKSNLQGLTDVAVFDTAAQPDTPSDFLLFAAETEIQSLSLDPDTTSAPIPSITNLRGAVAVDFDSQENYIYFSQVTAKKISRVRKGSNEIEDLIAVNKNSTGAAYVHEITSVEGLAFDWVGKKLYWADLFRNRIYSASLNKTKPVVIAVVQSPRALAIHPCKGYIFWSDWGRTPKIERATMAGNQRQVIVSSDLGWPNGLSIDFDEEKIYWADAQKDRIERSSLDGNYREVIVQTTVHPFSLTVFGYHIYWTDWTLRGVYRAEKHTGGNMKMLVQGLSTRPMGIIAFSSSRQKCDADPCGNHNGGCSHSCHPAPDGGVECTCEERAGLVIGNGGKMCVPENNTCSDDEFVCTNGRSTHTCDPKYFHCTNGRCVPLRYRCDFDNDCRDNSDELGCEYPTCGPDQFTCQNYFCIDNSLKCNGIDNCRDGNRTDELNCHDFHCERSHKCIPKTWQCDGDDDCGFGEDEGSFCASFNRTCLPDHFTCANGRCISSRWVCDAEDDCGDNSDESEERNCNERTCPPNTFTCTSNKEHGTYPCIDMSRVCDGFRNCQDDYRTCTSEQFTCDNQRCIPQTWACDGDNDCGDHSDEKEERCLTPEPTCPGNQFRCDSGQCIHYEVVCNKQFDCEDESDEQHCNVNECDTPRTNQCQHQCIDTLTSFKCQCNDGYRIMTDRHSCRDVNECEEEPGSCSQVCENLEGSFMCKCSDGYEKLSDGRTCKKTDNITPWLVFANRYYLREMTTEGESYRRIAQGFENVVSLDFDIQNDHIYFTDVKTHKVQKIYINGTQLETVMQHDVPSVEGIAVDWIGRKLYWVDGKKGAIFVSEMNGTSRHMLLRSGVQRPRSIVTDPINGFLYWSDWGSRPYIGRMSLDGTNISTSFITDKMGWPNALTIDYESNRLWWADAHLDIIEFIGVDGTGRHTVMEGVPHPPMDIHIYHPLRQKPGENPCGEDNGGCSHLCLIAPGGDSYTCVCPDFFYLSSDKRTCVSNCSLAQFRCGPTDDRCIPLLWKCDGEPDCLDGADEPEDCRNKTCAANQHRCDNGNCVPKSWVCDFDDDCESRTCKVGWWSCETNYRCVPNWARCDGENDCRDNSDEKEANCQVCHTTEDTYRQCSESEFRCDNQKCVQGKWRCDHDDDCGDGSDEDPAICTNFSECGGDQFTCDSGHCISKLSVCNSRRDCLDGSDESDCPARYPNGQYCAPSQFACRNHVCIPGNWKCDGMDDCGDESDEQNCRVEDCDETTHFLCLNRKCIPRWRMCDDVDNCGDGSDEDDRYYKDVGMMNCAVNNGGCEHNCTDLSGGGFYCSCRSGFRIVATDSKSCEDVDECAAWGNFCPQECQNVKGSFKCQCVKGFFDTENKGLECKAADRNVIVLFTMGHEVRQYRSLRKDYSDEVVAGQQAYALDVDPPRQLVYWTDTDLHRINRAVVPKDDDVSTIPQDLRIGGLDRPEGLSVDWVAFNIYWTDAGKQTISVAKSDGRYKKTLVSEDLEYPLALAVNPRTGYMYWSDVSSTAPKIERAWMNGEKRETLVSERLTRPSSIAIDFFMGDRIYWCDSKENIIESMKPDGTDRVVVLAKGVHMPVSIDVFEGGLVFVAQEEGKIIRVDKFAQENARTIQTGLHMPRAVSIFHIARYDISIKSNCSAMPCSHLCLIVPGGVMCACPEGTDFVKGSNTVCDAAIEIERPDPKKCPCQHGGTCVKPDNAVDVTCVCPSGYTGDFCEIAELSGTEAASASANVAIIVPVVVALAVIILLVVLVVVLRRRGVDFNFKKLMTKPSLGSKKKTQGVVSFRDGGQVKLGVPGMAPDSSGTTELEQVTMEGVSGSLHDPTSPTNFSNPMYDSLHAHETITLPGNPAPRESSTDDDPSPPPPPPRSDVVSDRITQAKGANDGPELRIVPRALDPTDDVEHDTAGLVRQGSL
ncbi:hypothetical protein BaRGS_00000926, partial [Batillaria attramentaria]